jgi:hypothetical protein
MAPALSEYAPHIIAALGALVVCLAAWLLAVSSRLAKLTRGGKSGTLDEAIGQIDADIAALKEFARRADAGLKLADRRLRGAIRGVSARNFSAFQGLESGGQSGAVALVTEAGDGVIVSTISSRERVNVFTKPVEAGACALPLSDEERAALESAQKSCAL